jgi:Domain of unknown function (DUF892)
MDGRLKDTMATAAARIAEHVAKLRSLVGPPAEKARNIAAPWKGHVREAKAHVVDSGSGHDSLNDLLIISQSQRMSHDGLAGFGTAAAYAKAALDRSDDENTLKAVAADIYEGERSPRVWKQLCLSSTGGGGRSGCAPGSARKSSSTRSKSAEQIADSRLAVGANVLSADGEAADVTQEARGRTPAFVALRQNQKARIQL